MKKYVPALLVLLALGSCVKKQPLPANVTSTLTGRCYDSYANKPIPGCPVFIGAFKYGWGYGGSELQLSGIVDSAIADNAGNYRLTFTSPAGYDVFKIIARPPAIYWPGYSFSAGPVIPLGKDTTINFDATHMSILKLAVSIVNNPQPSIGMQGWYNNTFSLAHDTTIDLKIKPDSKMPVSFTVGRTDSPKLWNSLDTFFTVTGFADTFYQSVTVYPSNFH